MATYRLESQCVGTDGNPSGLSSVNTTIEDGKYYSFYMSGIYNTTAKNVEGFVVEDNFAIATDTTTACAATNRTCLDNTANR